MTILSKEEWINKYKAQRYDKQNLQILAEVALLQAALFTARAKEAEYFYNNHPEFVDCIYKDNLKEGTVRFYSSLSEDYNNQATALLELIA